MGLVPMLLIQMLIFAVMLSLTACFYPMGLNKKQWDALAPSQQAEYQAKQYQIDADNKVREQEAQKQVATLKSEQTRLDTERLKQAYATAQYGDIVTVTVQGGSLSYARKRYSYEPVAFDLIKGETKKVVFRGQGAHVIIMEYMTRLSDDGNTFYFNDGNKFYFNDESLQRSVFVNHDWEHGETYQSVGNIKDANVELSGMTFFIKLKNLQGAPQRVIIENR